MINDFDFMNWLLQQDRDTLTKAKKEFEMDIARGGRLAGDLEARVAIIDKVLANKK